MQHFALVHGKKKRQLPAPPGQRQLRQHRHYPDDLSLGIPAKLATVAAVGAVLAGCGGSSHTTTTAMSTLPAVTKTVTLTVTPPPPPGPKTSIETNGTFIVGSDIAPGTYRATGKDGCYWARLRSLDTGDIIDNNVGDGPQAVQILASDKAFMTRNCGKWEKVG